MLQLPRALKEAKRGNVNRRFEQDWFARWWPIIDNRGEQLHSHEVVDIN
jgi:hypothetical protein